MPMGRVRRFRRPAGTRSSKLLFVAYHGYRAYTSFNSFFSGIFPYFEKITSTARAVSLSTPLASRLPSGVMKNEEPFGPIYPYTVRDSISRCAANEYGPNLYGRNSKKALSSRRNVSLRIRNRHF